MAIPLAWKLLGKAGNSSQAERIRLMEKFLSWFPLDFPVKLVADREFIGHTWLDEKHIHYVIRIPKPAKATHLGREKQVGTIFCSPYFSTLRKSVEINGLELYLCGHKLDSDDHFILLPNLFPMQVAA